MPSTGRSARCAEYQSVEGLWVRCVSRFTAHIYNSPLSFFITSSCTTIISSNFPSTNSHHHHIIISIKFSIHQLTSSSHHHINQIFHPPTHIIITSSCTIKFSIYQLRSSSHHHVPSNFPSITPSSSSHHHVPSNFSIHQLTSSSHHFFHPSAHFVHPSTIPSIKSLPSNISSITSLFGR